MFRNKFASFLRECSGSVSIAYALALLPLIGAAGAAIDYSRATNEQAKLQQATDAAALEAVLTDATSDQQRIEQAKTVVKAAKPGAVVTAVVEGTTVTVTSRGEVGTLLLQTLGMDRVSLATKAAATLAMNGPPACVLALNETASPAISFSGNSSFTGKGCAVQSNSRSPTALVVQGSATAKADAFCAVGGYSSNGAASPKP